MTQTFSPRRGLTVLVAFTFFAVANSNLLAMPISDSIPKDSTTPSLTSAGVLDLNGSTWRLIGQDLTSWNDSLLTFTLHLPDGSLTGHFDWISTGLSAYGRELFKGDLNADLTFTLNGFQMDPHPVLGSPRGVVLADYTGRFTPDGRSIVDGTWIGRNGVRGTWESVAVPEASSWILIGFVGACLFGWRLRRHVVG